MNRKYGIGAVTLEEVRHILSYDSQTGDFVWRNPVRPHLKGRVAGATVNDRYKFLRLNGRRYPAHRIAWFYVHGEWAPYDIDHIDGNPSNNAIWNLRPATRAQNMANAHRRKGRIYPKGVRRQKGRFTARIRQNGRLIHLGSYRTLEEAAQAYALEAKRLFGEFARIE